MPAEIRIRPLEAGDEPAWRKLWSGYCRYYQVTIDAGTTQHTWDRLMAISSPVKAIVADSADEGVVGIANYILHENTWEVAPVCYLEDLFVAPDLRGTGVGRQLIDWLVAAMAREGWSRLYWMTKENNYRARGLYDKYAPRDGFVRYVVKPSK